MAAKAQKGAEREISWSTVLLICGVVTYVAVMQKAGAVDYVGQAISHLEAPLLAALLLCFTGAIVSAFASSTALLGAIIPLAVPFLLTGQVGAVGVVAEMRLSSHTKRTGAGSFWYAVHCAVLKAPCAVEWLAEASPKLQITSASGCPPWISASVTPE